MVNSPPATRPAAEQTAPHEDNAISTAIAILPAAGTVRSLAELDIVAHAQALDQRAATGATWELRPADDSRRLAVIPMPWPIAREQFVANSLAITGGADRSGRFELTPTQLRLIGELPDGDYLLAWNIAGQRRSNVARFTVAVQHDLKTDPSLQLLPLEPAPGQTLPIDLDQGRPVQERADQGL